MRAGNETTLDSSQKERRLTPATENRHYTQAMSAVEQQTAANTHLNMQPTAYLNPNIL